MSVGSLISMRPSWLLESMKTLSGNFDFDPRLTPAPGLAGTETITWANAQAAVTYDAGNRFIKCTPDGQKAFGFLPWRAGGVTYMEIDANAQLVLTGPLTACTIWAFQAGGTTVLVHANANGDTSWGNMSIGQRQQNMATKLGMINRIKALYPGAVDSGRLVYAPMLVGATGATTYEGYMGFVIGVKPRNGFSLNKVSWTKSSGRAAWQFYFYGFNGPDAADRVLLPLT
jgi:hypothetical protein